MLTDKPEQVAREAKERQRQAGGDRKSEETKLPLKNQSDLAEELNMSKVQLRKYKSFTDLIPELQDAVQTLVK